MASPSHLPKPSISVHRRVMFPLGDTVNRRLRVSNTLLLIPRLTKYTYFIAVEKFKLKSRGTNLNPPSKPRGGKQLEENVNEDGGGNQNEELTQYLLLSPPEVQMLRTILFFTFLSSSKLCTVSFFSAVPVIWTSCWSSTSPMPTE